MPFAALAFSVAIAGACGGKSVVVEDDGQAGDTSSGKGGSTHKGGSSGKGEKGGTGGDVIATGGSGGTGGGSRGGTGGSRGGTGGSRGGTGGTGGTTGGSAGRGGAGGTGGVAGSFAGVGAVPSGGRAGAGRGGDAGAPLGGFGGFAGLAGAPVAGFAGNPCGCYDGNPCTDDLCLELGNCVYRYNTAACDDGNACTAGDFCGSGVCNPGMAISCDDGNGCTLDNCDPKGGCMYREAGTGRDSTERKIPDSELDCGPPSRSAVSTVTLEDEGDVTNLSVSVTLEHPYAGDLTLVLAHDGVSVTLFDRFPGDGGLAADFKGTYTFAAEGDDFELLDKDAIIPAGTYGSLGPLLTVFVGHPSAGDWTLTVSDGCHGDKGTLKEFVLNVSSSCTAADLCSGSCNSGECMCPVPP